MGLRVRLIMPGTCPSCAHHIGDDVTVFEFDVPHPIAREARMVGLYDCVWRPDAIGVTHARDLLEPLRAGLVRASEHPERSLLNLFFVPWIRSYLAVCELHPGALVEALR